ncbi:MAG TPA: hypothetical protein VNO31_02325 [Umezawaea sp.]|nr:hypothetical protein [Umezawaea sp.]
MDARTRARKLAAIRAGKCLFAEVLRGTVVVGPTAAVVPEAIVTVTEDSGATVTVRIVVLLGKFSRDGVDYTTAIFTRSR